MYIHSLVSTLNFTDASEAFKNYGGDSLSRNRNLQISDRRLFEESDGGPIHFDKTTSNRGWQGGISRAMETYYLAEQSSLAWINI